MFSANVVCKTQESWNLLKNMEVWVCEIIVACSCYLSNVTHTVFQKYPLPRVSHSSKSCLLNDNSQFVESRLSRSGTKAENMEKMTQMLITEVGSVAFFYKQKCFRDYQSSSLMCFCQEEGKKYSHAALTVSTWDIFWQRKLDSPQFIRSINIVIIAEKRD